MKCPSWTELFPSHLLSPCMITIALCMSATRERPDGWSYLRACGPERFKSQRICRGFCLIAKSCLTLRDPMDCSMPGFPVLHYLWVCPSLCPLSWWCHLTISSSVTPFSSCLHSFPASGSFPMSQSFTDKWLQHVKKECLDNVYSMLISLNFAHESCTWFPGGRYISEMWMNLIISCSCSWNWWLA